MQQSNEFTITDTASPEEKEYQKQVNSSNSNAEANESDSNKLNKCDLADEAALDKVTKAVRKINPNAEIIRCQYGQVEPKKLIKINAFALEKVPHEPDADEA